METAFDNRFIPWRDQEGRPSMTWINNTGAAFQKRNKWCQQQTEKTERKWSVMRPNLGSRITDVQKEQNISVTLVIMNKNIGYNVSCSKTCCKIHKIRRYKNQKLKCFLKWFRLWIHWSTVCAYAELRWWAISSVQNRIQEKQIKQDCKLNDQKGAFFSKTMLLKGFDARLLLAGLKF